MGAWTLDDIPWDSFERNKLDREIVRVVKAASLVEHNGAAYAHHLCRIFADDPEFQATARRWGEEEIQHGRALARWAALADPGFDFGVAFARFQAGFQIDFDSDRSRRGAAGRGRVAPRWPIRYSISGSPPPASKPVSRSISTATAHAAARARARW